MTEHTAVRVGAIDCGTNSIRLLIAEVGADASLRDIDRRMSVVRLGHGVDKTRRFDPAAIDRTLAATREFAGLLEDAQVEGLRFVATSATRDAHNREEFLGGVEEILGIRPEVISGDEEAELSFRGAVQSLPDPGPAPRLVVDIGGGSTELVVGGSTPEAQISLDMGSVRLTERHLEDDPPTEEAIAAAVRDIDALLDGASRSVPWHTARSIVGVAGTVTTLTAVLLGLEEYTPEATHGASLDARDHIEMSRGIAKESVAERSRRRAIHSGRVDVIGAGALIWARIVERLAEQGGLDRITTSEHDILDGIALSVADHVWASRRA